MPLILDTLKKKDINVSATALEIFCNKWGVAELSVFGSILRDSFNPSSDIDILVSFKPDARRDIFDLVDIQTELQLLFGRRVDLLTKKGIENSRNEIRKQDILNSSKVIYALS